MNLYQEQILDHYKNPRNTGELVDADFVSCEENTLCGDVNCLYIKVKNGRVEEVRSKATGCAISVASASLLTEKMKGMPLSQARNLTREDIIEILGVEVTPARLKCALLPLESLRSALQ